MLGQYTATIHCPRCDTTVSVPYLGEIIHDPTGELTNIELAYSSMTFHGSQGKDTEKIQALEDRFNERRKELGTIDTPPAIDIICPQCGNKLSNLARGGKVMDESKTYAKMCEKAEEIQKQKPEGSQGEFIFCNGIVYQEMDDRLLTPFVWLPRQDQLQEMIWQFDFATSPYFANTTVRAQNAFLVRDFCRYCEGIGFEQGSMEQLWLAYIQKEIYEKVWDSKKEAWVK